MGVVVRWGAFVFYYYKLEGVYVVCFLIASWCSSCEVYGFPAQVRGVVYTGVGLLGSGCVGVRVCEYGYPGSLVAV